MKKIVFSVLVILAVGVLTAYNSFALWSDQETVENNSIQSDKLDLVSVSAPISIVNATPGATGESDAILLTNDSNSVQGNLSFTISNLAGYENGCPEAESNEGNDLTCGDIGLGEGELEEHLKVGIISDLDEDGIYETTVGEDYVSNLSGPYSIGDLAPGNTAAFKITYSIDNSITPFVDNIFMTDSVEFDVNFTLTQN